MRPVHGLPPPTPPDIRVTYPAVRWIAVRVSHHPNRSVVSRRASREFIPDAGHEARHLAGCHLAAPPQATTPLHRSGLRPTRVAAPPICCPAFRPWGASRASPAPGLLCPLLTSARRSGRIAPPSVLYQDTPQISRGQLSYRRCIDAGFIKHAPTVDGGLCGRVPSSSRAYHTSYPVRVPRPAPSFHASFRPHLTVTPWRFPCPSAPRTPGQGTFTPKHDRMHGTHVRVKLHAVACRCVSA